MTCAEINVVPQAVDLKLYAGDAFSVRLVVTDRRRQPVDIRGDYLAQIRTTADSATIAAEFDVNFARAQVGELVLMLTSADTTVLGANFNGVWDCQWTGFDGNPHTLARGKVEVVGDVSRS